MGRTLLRLLTILTVAISAIGAFAASSVAHDHGTRECHHCSHACPGRRRFIEQVSLSQEQVVLTSAEAQVSVDTLQVAPEMEQEAIFAEPARLVSQAFRSIAPRAPPCDASWQSTEPVSHYGRAPPVC